MGFFSFLLAGAADLHTLGKSLPAGAIHFELQDLARSGAEFAVEATYRPYRSQDVRTERNLNLFGSPWYSRPRETISVNRTDTHTLRQAARVSGTILSFTIPLHATEAGFEAYQLERVRVGRVVFGRWFDKPPELAPEFGLRSASDSLQGAVRLAGIAADPLNGSLPLWPALRTVRLSVSTASQPVVQLWDPLTKHHWDGWRNSTPEHWTGGRTITTRRADGTTVWRAHQYFEYAPAGAPQHARPAPPADALAGAALEIFWPHADRGDTANTGNDKLEFPDAFFGQPATVIAMPVAALSARARDILARSVERRPGLEVNSMTAAEWDEIRKLATNTDDLPVKFEITKTAGGKDLLAAHRKKLAEPWLYLFGVQYDAERRFATSALLLNPNPWSGPLLQ